MLAWQCIVWLWAPRSWLLPSPAQVAATAVDHRGRLWFHAQATLLETGVGLAVAVAVGLVLAVGIAASRVLDLTLSPWVVASQAVPVLSLAPILAIWLGYTTTQIAVAALMCVFPVIVTAVDGFRAADPGLIRTMRSMGAGRAWLWRHVTLPSALPVMFSGLRMAAVFAVTGAVVAEYVGADRGLGYLTVISTGQFDTRLAMAAVGLLALIGIGLFGLVAACERLAFPHRSRPTRPSWRAHL